MALKNSGYKAKCVYKTMNETLDVLKRKNNRARKILWLMPSHNMVVANKLDREFLRLLKKNFPSSTLSHTHTHTHTHIYIYIYIYIYMYIKLGIQAFIR